MIAVYKETVDVNILLTKLNEMQKYLEWGRIQ